MNKKTFWEKSEGTTGMIFIILVGFIGVYLASMLLPLLVNALVAAVVGTVLFGFVALLMSPKVHTAGSYLFKVAMRWITGWIIELDPIAILEGHVKEWEKRLNKVQKGLISVKAEKRRIVQDLNANTKEYNQRLAEAKLAKQQGNNARLVSLARMIRMVREQRKVFDTLFRQTDTSLKALTRIHTVAKVKLEEESFSLETKRTQWAAVQRNRSITKEITSILNGIDASELYDRANGFIEDSMYESEAEIEMLDDLTSGMYAALEARDTMELERLTQLITAQETRLVSGVSGALPDFVDLDDDETFTEIEDDEEGLSFESEFAEIPEEEEVTAHRRG